FYLDDSQWGESFLKVCSYAPWGLKLRLNGHEWLKRQLAQQGIGFEALDNGFLSCQDPKRLQELADSLGPAQLESFLAKWLDRLPLPLSASDRAAGYDYKLSVRQLEVSLTQIMDRPVAGRQFFEEVIRDNLDLGRPDRVQLIFPRKIIRTTPGSFRTRILREGVHPSLHVSYKHFDLKQYYKEGRGLRTEGTLHDPGDFGVNKGIENLPSLKELGHQINQRLLEVERVSQNCGLSAGSIQRVVQPTVTQDGQRAPGLKFGDPRVMALMLSLCAFGCLIDGFRSRELRRRVAALLGLGLQQYSASQMSYDLRRLLRKGNHLPCRWEPTLLSDSLRLETGTVLCAAGGASISPSADSDERTTNCIECSIKQSAADHRCRTGSTDSSGVSPSQSWLKNSALLYNLFG